MNLKIGSGVQNFGRFEQGVGFATKSISSPDQPSSRNAKVPSIEAGEDRKAAPAYAMPIRFRRAETLIGTFIVPQRRPGESSA